MFHVKHICYVAPAFICTCVLLFCCKFDGAKSIFWCLTWNKHLGSLVPKTWRLNRACTKIFYRVATMLSLNRIYARAIMITNCALSFFTDVSYETHNENLAQIILLWQKKSRTTHAINIPIKKLGRRATRWLSAQIDCEAADKIAEKVFFNQKMANFGSDFFRKIKIILSQTVWEAFLNGIFALFLPKIG